MVFPITAPRERTDINVKFIMQREINYHFYVFVTHFFFMKIEGIYDDSILIVDLGFLFLGLLEFVASFRKICIF